MHRGKTPIQYFISNCEDTINYMAIDCTEIQLTILRRVNKIKLR